MYLYWKSVGVEEFFLRNPISDLLVFIHPPLSCPSSDPDMNVSIVDTSCPIFMEIRY
jgi:hypothetical protein